MLHSFLVACSVVLAIAAGSAAAQQAQPAQNDRVAQADTALVGQAVYSSDGQRLGEIAEVGSSSGQPVVRAELDEAVGIEPRSVLIVAHALQQRNNRIELPLTVAEVKDTLSKQKQQEQVPQEKSQPK